MTKKKVLFSITFVISLVFYFLQIASLTIRFVLGTLDTFSTIILHIMYVLLFLNVIIILDIKFTRFKQYRNFVEGYNYLKSIHTIRYRLYFLSTREQVEDYSQKVQTFGKNLLDVGNQHLSGKTLNKKQLCEIQEMLCKTEELLQKEYVTF